MRSGSFCVVVVVLLMSAGRAFASTDINGLFDARSHGMGGTGVAFLDSAGAIPTNPALLDQIGKLTISLDVFGIVAQPEAPYTIYHLDANGQHYRDFETERSAAVFAPLPFLGGAYRLFDRVVIGIAAYPVIGQGASAQYRPAPDEFPNLVANNKAQLGLLEAAESVSVRVLDNLSVAASWRITYMTQSVSTPVPLDNMTTGVLSNVEHTAATNADISVKGLNLLGFQLGVLYKIVPSLRLGVSYRSKVVVDGTGTTTTRIGTSAVVLDTRTNYANPHAFRAGFAWSTLDDRLLIAADFKYLMYAEAFNSITTITTMNGKDNVKVQPLHWKDAFNVQLGVEYKAGDIIKLRAGYIMATSATPKDYALAFTPPPGVSQLGSIGLGVKALDSLDIDAAGAIVVLQSHVDQATPNNAGVGIYASHGTEFSLSATYHM